MDKLLEPKITEKYEEKEKLVKDEKMIVKKHLDDLFEEEFLNDYFKDLKKTRKKELQKKN